MDGMKSTYTIHIEHFYSYAKDQKYIVLLYKCSSSTQVAFRATENIFKGGHTKIEESLRPKAKFKLHDRHTF